MFPSGPWRGYWEQVGWGRQAMNDFVLRFVEGTVLGQGTDCIGPFTFQGRYDQAGRVTLIKHYLGRHTVKYEGSYDGEGTIFGRWSIGTGWSGPFAMSPVAARPAADAPIQTL
jgi:hypothetical protein